MPKPKTDAIPITAKYPVYDDGVYLAMIYRIRPKRIVRNVRKPFTSHWIDLLLFRNLNSGINFTLPPPRIWVKPGPVNESGWGRGTDSDLNKIALSLGVKEWDRIGHFVVPKMVGMLVLVKVEITPIKKDWQVTQYSPLFDRKGKVIGEKEKKVDVIANRNHVTWFAPVDPSLELHRIPDGFDFDEYCKAQKKKSEERAEKEQTLMDSYQPKPATK